MAHLSQAANGWPRSAPTNWAPESARNGNGGETRTEARRHHARGVKRPCRQKPPRNGGAASASEGTKQQETEPQPLEAAGRVDGTRGAAMPHEPRRGRRGPLLRNHRAMAAPHRRQKEPNSKRRSRNRSKQPGVTKGRAAPPCPMSPEGGEEALPPLEENRRKLLRMVPKGGLE